MGSGTGFARSERPSFPSVKVRKAAEKVTDRRLESSANVELGSRQVHGVLYKGTVPGKEAKSKEERKEYKGKPPLYTSA